jgi:hypothetical protein
MIKPSIKTWVIQEHGHLGEMKEVIDSSFYFILELEIEYTNMQGIDDYSIKICDKKGLKIEIDKIFESEFEKRTNANSCFLSKAVILKEFDKKKIIELITEFVNNCSGNNYDEVHLKLQQKLEYHP